MNVPTTLMIVVDILRQVRGDSGTRTNSDHTEIVVPRSISSTSQVTERFLKASGCHLMTTGAFSFQQGMVLHHRA